MEQKLYQLIISRIDGEKLSSVAYQEQAIELVNKGIGGFILFGGQYAAVKAFIAKLQSISKIPLFIASDIERGAGQQVEGAARFPFQMALAAAIDREKTGDVKMLQDAISAVAEEAIDIGINMPLIPVLDVNSNPDNPIICTRAFSDNRETVAWFGNIYIRILEDAGRISCAKHFPGHGDTSADSHIELPVITKSLKDLRDTELYPFIEAIKDEVSSVMIGHISIPAIDTLPASLSKKVITDLLRNEIGFNGLVLTDALNMHALREFGNVPVQCMNAGVDILLHPSDADETVLELKQAVESGELAEGTIDAAVERIMKFKKRAGGLRVSSMRGGVDYAKHAELAAMLFDKSITLVKDAPGLLPLKDIQNVQLVVVGSNDASTLLQKHLMRDRFPIKASGMTELKTETLIFAVFTKVSAWTGSSGIKDEEVLSIREAMKAAQHSIVISFGSPYVLRHFTDASVLIAAYDATEQAQLSVVKCLKGEREFQGRLPVSF